MTDLVPEAAEPSKVLWWRRIPFWARIAAPVAVVAIAAAIVVPAVAASNNLEPAFFQVTRTMPAYANLSDSSLRDAGHAVCNLFDKAVAAGANGWAESVKAASTSDDDLLQANILVTGAVSAYCPAHKVDIPAEYRPK